MNAHCVNCGHLASALWGRVYQCSCECHDEGDAK